MLDVVIIAGWLGLMVALWVSGEAGVNLIPDYLIIPGLVCTVLAACAIGVACASHEAARMRRLEKLIMGSAPSRRRK
ncbi:MAG: hypothetical protein ABIJ96_01830 [Elusimicrobiota bacterium]